MGPGLHATLGALAVAAVALAGNAVATEPEPTELWLREGAGLSVSAPTDGSTITLGLVGRAWSVNPQDGFAKQISDDVEVARQPVVSPDGSLIAYETMRDGFHQIMVRAADGSMPRQVTFGRFNHRSPSWSPAGAADTPTGMWVTMSSDRGGRYGIWEVEVDTLELRQLTFAQSDEREPAWNADGTRIAYVADTPGGTALYAVTPGEQPDLLVEEPAVIRAPAWRPGGGLLTYVRQLPGSSQLRMLILSQPAITKPITQDEHVFPYPAHWFDRMRFLYTADGQIRERVFGERTATTVAFNARIPVTRDAWATRELSLENDGTQVVRGHNGYSVASDGSAVVAALGDLWELRADGTLMRQLTSDPFVDAHPALSPDGARVVFVSDRGGSLQLWLLELDTARMRQLTRERGVALYPAWTGDGSAIDYLAAAHVAAPDMRAGHIELTPEDAPGAEPEDADPAAPTIGGTPSIPLTWRPMAGSGRMIVRAGRIFDGLGPDYLREHEIVIEAGRISAVRPWSDDGNDEDTVVDARERVVIPGLIDLTVGQARLGDERLGRKYLAYGVTAIRETVTNPAEATERRESWESGRRIGPRLLTADTPCPDMPGGLAARPVLQPAVTQQSFRMRIDEAIERGSVSIGLCPTLNAGARVDLIAAVHARGLPVMTSRAFPDVLLGADESRLPPPELAGYDDFAVVAGALGITVTSNLAGTGLPLLAARGELPGGWQYRRLFTAAERRWYASARKPSEADLASARANIRRMVRGLIAAVAHGARAVTGTDTPRVPPGLAMHVELRLLADAGLQPFQALRMATLDAGRALGAGDRIGTIRPGAVADLVIVDGDPLHDIRDASNVTMTIARGRPYTRRELGSAGTRPTTVGKLYN